MSDTTDTTEQSTVERLERLVDRLEAMGVAARSTLPASVNPDGTPGHVAAGELIESAWGNAVVDTLMGVKALNDSQQGPIGSNTARLNALEPRMGAAESNIATVNARTFWNRENSNDQSRYAGTWYGTTNGNGEFWVLLPFVMDVSSAVGLVQVADINIGAWVVVVDFTANSLHCRLFSPTGFVPNLACGFSYQLNGARTSPYP